jgi:pimeloyl-ACP methyl ester carboxylesterase
VTETTTSGQSPAAPAASAEDPTTMRPFQVELSDAALDELRRRTAATRWPSKELVTDASQGVQQAVLQELARYWASDYDLRRVEARMLDHGADSYEKISRAFVDGSPAGGLTRDRILDNLTLYWLTNTATSSARLHWEGARSTAAAAAAGRLPPAVSLPVAFTVFPGEIFRAPRSWAERVYPNLVYFNEVDRGGHFAAWEEPQLFTDELRAALRSLRWISVGRGSS